MSEWRMIWYDMIWYGMRELNVRSKADWNQLCSVTYHIKRRVPLSRRQTNREQYKQTNFFAPVTKNERKFIFGMQGGLNLRLIAASGAYCHKALDFIQLCLVLPPPSFSACVWSICTHFLFHFLAYGFFGISSESFSYIKMIGSRSRSQAVALPAMGHVSPSTSNNFVFRSLWSKSDSQLF